MSKSASVEELLKSGAHFGHLTRRWNPKMKEFIFMSRNGIHIIDLKKTEVYLKEALKEVSELARAGKTILFVGTKKQAQEIIKTEAIRCGMPFITHRWLGGMLTNFSTVRKSISRMEEIEKMKQDGTFDEITKKEGLMLDRERIKLEQTLGGIANMNRIPGAIFVVDTIKEHIAMNEAVKLNIPIIALVDTNSDPDIPDYIIPANDDSARTIQLISSLIADAIIDGNAEREVMKEEELMEQAAVEAKIDTTPAEEEAVSESPGVRKRTRKRKKVDAPDKKKSAETKEVKVETKEVKADDPSEFDKAAEKEKSAQSDSETGVSEKANETKEVEAETEVEAKEVKADNSAESDAETKEVEAEESKDVKSDSDSDSDKK